jgi:hypothetical protein
MDNLENNLKYTTGLPIQHFKYYGEGLPSTYAMIWCMMATGVSRIFNKEDMKEFLFRLPIALNSMALIETWFIKDRLMNYKFKEKEYVLRLKDVIMHFGLEAYDHYKNHSDRESYLQCISTDITAAMVVGYFGDFSVIKPEEKVDFGEMFSGKKHVPELTPKLITNAEFFANDLMKFIPERTFSDCNQSIREKERELEIRIERIKNLPVFDIKKIPTDIIIKCLKIMYKDEYIKHLLNHPDEFEKKGKPLIYLAWLIANDFMILDGLSTHEKEGITLNYMDYELEGGGFNLGETIEMYNLEEMGLLLKKLMI